MSGKRSFAGVSLENVKRRKSNEILPYFQRILQDCGLVLKSHPEKCIATKDAVYIVRDLKKSLHQHEDYPHNIETFLSEFKTACNDDETFKHYLFLNIVRHTDDRSYNVDKSVFKILLNVTLLQTKLITYIFDKVMDKIEKPEFVSWVKMILKSFSNLDTVESSEELSAKLIDLLDISSDKFVRLEIISAIPDIIGDREHDNVASEMSRILSTDRFLIPSILDCLTYLCLSDLQFQKLQKATLNLMQPSNAAYFSNFVKFLLTPGRLSDSDYEETIKGLRKELGWSSIMGSQEDIATSQILTAREIRNSMLSSKVVAKTWIKVISSCTSHTEHKPIDIIFFLIVASLSDEQQKNIENVMRKRIKLQILKAELIAKALKTFKPILIKYIMTSINLANSLLRPGADPLVEAFGAHMHTLMFSELTECRPIIVSELLQVVLNSKKSALSILNVLNDIASKNLPVMKLQSSQMLILLDRLDDMSVTDLKAVMNLVCGLAYSFEDSDIRDEVHIIIRKQLGSSIPSIKIQGILAGIHAVKYLVQNTTEEVDVPEDVTFSMVSCLPDGDLREAAQIIELIHHSTAQFPDMVTLFYDQLQKVINEIDDIDKNFLAWLTYALTSYWHDSFLVDHIQKDIIGGIKLSMQLSLNQDSEVEEDWAVNIAGVILDDNKDVNVGVLSSMFQLVRILQNRKNNGCLSEIDAILGAPIVMPVVDIDCINDLNELSVKKILECYTSCVNWIRELLNAFVPEQDVVLQPKIISRILQLGDLERTIVKIRDKPNNPGYKDASTPGSSRTQQPQVIKTKYASNIQFRPFDLCLINVLKYDLSSDNISETELTFQNFSYVLSHINNALEKVLVPRIKKKTYLSKDVAEIYSYSETESQAKAVKTVLPNLMKHVDFIFSYLDRCVFPDGNIDLEGSNSLNITEGMLCLESIYDLLTVYFRWIEFRHRNVALLKSSLHIVAKVDDDKVLLEELLITAAKSFESHQKYMTSISCAASLMQFMKALQELSTGPRVPTILENMAFKFLSTQWKTMHDQPEKGLFYNQSLDNLTNVYLGNNSIEGLKKIVSSLVDEVGNLRDGSSILSTLQSINKSNFSILFRNLGSALCDKIKSRMSGGFTNPELVDTWATAANILKLMSSIVTTLRNKHTSAYFFKKSIPVLNLFLTKGFPILKIEWKDKRQTILDLLRDFQTSSECLGNICCQTSDSALMQKIPNMEELLTSFTYKTKDLLKANDSLECLKMFNVKDVPDTVRRSKSVVQKPVAVGVPAVDDELTECESDTSEDFVQYLCSVSDSDVI